MTIIASLLMKVEADVEAAKANLESVGTKAEETGSRLAGMGTLAKGAALGAVGGIIELGKQLGDSVKAAQGQQAAMAQLNNAIAQSGNTSGITADAIDKMAGHLSQITPTTKDAALGAAQMILPFQHIGADIFPQVLTAADNLSVKFGMALPAASRLVAQALDAPATGLGRLSRFVGKLTQDQQDNIKTMIAHGDTMGAQTAIIDLLNKATGGAAETAGQTFGGAMQIAKNRVEELRIGVGNLLLPVLTKLLDFWNVLGNLFTDHIEPIFASISERMNGLATAIGGGLNSALGKMGGLWQGLDGVVQAIIRTFGGLADGLQHVWGTLQQTGVFTALGDTLGHLGGALGDLLGHVQRLFSGFSAGGVNLAGLTPIVTDAANVFKFIGNTLASLADIVGRVVSGLYGAGGAVSGIAQGAFTQAAGIVHTLAGVFATVADTLTHTVLPAVGPLATAALGLLGSLMGLRNAVSASLLPVLGLLVPVLQFLVPLVGGALVTAANLLTPLLNGIATAIKWMTDQMHQGTVVGQLLHGLLLVLAAVLAQDSLIAIRDFAAGMVEAVAGLVTSIPVIVAQTAAWIADAAAMVAANLPLIALVAAIGLVVGAGILLVQHWGAITTFLHDTWQRIWGAITGIAVAAAHLIVAPFVLEFDILRGVWEAVSGALLAGWQGLVTAVTPILAPFIAIFSDIFSVAFQLVTDLWKFTFGALVTSWQNLAAIAGTVWAAITGAITTVWSALVTTIQGLWTAITTWLTTAWNNFVKAVATAWAPIQTALTGPWLTVETAIHDTWNRVTGWLTAAWDTIKDNATRAWGAISGVIGNAWDGIRRGIDTQVNNVIGILNGAIGGFNTLARGLIGALSNVDKAIGGHGFAAPPALPLIAPLPGLAAGTPAWRGGPAWVGESGPELAYLPPGAAVLPHSQSVALAAATGLALPGLAGGIDPGALLGGIGHAVGNTVGSTASAVASAVGNAANLLHGVLATLDSQLQRLPGGPQFTAIVQDVEQTVQSTVGQWLTNTARAHHLSFADGGWVTEPVAGIGASGTRYSFGERGAEYVTPASPPAPTPAAAPPHVTYENHFHASMDDELARKVAAEQAWQARLHGGSV